MGKTSKTSTLQIGWAQADITPPLPILLCGQFHIRMAEGVKDPITATALVMDGGDDHAVFVSCDLVATSDELRKEVVSRLAGRAKGLDPQKIILNATHTHTAPEIRLDSPFRHEETKALLKLEGMDVPDYIRLAGGRIADAVAQAWKSRAAGRIAFGMGNAVVGRNRRWVNVEGVSRMYGNTDTELFSHVEGYEDHSVGVMAMRDAKGKWTGVAVNIACPSQVSGCDYTLSADFWHDTRVELRKRFGKKLFVLPQCSTAGDQCPHLLYEKKAHERMLDLAGRTERREYALRIADAVERVLNILGDRADAVGPLKHHVEILPLPMSRITKEQVRDALNEAETWKHTYEEEARKIESDPSVKDRPRWYVPVSQARSKMVWLQDVARRYEEQERGERKAFPCELHVIRLGDIAFATNPFEYYLDYGVFIKARSKAAQTFLVQLAGGGASYVPSLRSTLGGGYGSTPASNPVGPEGGRILAERTIERIAELFKIQPKDLADNVSWPDEWTVFLPSERNAKPLKPDYLKSVPARIKLGDETLEARKIVSTNGTFDFAPLLGRAEDGNTAFVYLTVKSPKKQETLLGFGADWWLEAWLNGERILDTTQKGNDVWPPSIGDYLVKVKLRRGTNILAVRFISGSKSSVLAIGGPDALRAVSGTYQ